MPDEQVPSTSKLSSKTSFATSKNNVSLNAHLDRIKQKARYKKQTREMAKQHRDQSRYNLKTKSESYFPYEKYKRAKIPRRIAKDILYNESEMRTDLSSASNTDETSDKGIGNTRKSSYPFKPKHKKTSLTSGLGADIYYVNSLRKTQSNGVYPNISGPFRPYSCHPPISSSFPNIQKQGLYEKQEYLDRYCPKTKQRSGYRSNGHMFKQRPQFARYIDTNNNMNSHDAVTIDESDEECPFSKQNYGTHDKTEVPEPNTAAEIDFFIFGDPVTFGRDLHTRKSVPEFCTEGYIKPGIKYEQKIGCSPRNITERQSQTLHDSQRMIHTLAGQYSYEHRMGEFSGYPAFGETQSLYSHPDCHDNVFKQVSRLELEASPNRSFEYNAFTTGKHAYSQYRNFPNIPILSESETDYEKENATAEEMQRNNIMYATEMYNDEILRNKDLIDNLIAKSGNKFDSYIKTFEMDGQTFYYVDKADLNNSVKVPTDDKDQLKGNLEVNIDRTSTLKVGSVSRTDVADNSNNESKNIVQYDNNNNASLNDTSKTITNVTDNDAIKD